MKNNQANKVYLNQGGTQGGTEGQFNDSGQNLGTSDSYGVDLGDMDGDGDLDAFVLNENQTNTLYINQGGAQSGTEGQFMDRGLNLGSAASRSISICDVDGDGDLDAFVANRGEANKVWLNPEAYSSGDVITAILS